MVKKDPKARRKPVFLVPLDDVKMYYEEQKSVEGETVGWICKQCGRLCEAPHREGCAFVTSVTGKIGL